MEHEKNETICTNHQYPIFYGIDTYECLCPSAGSDRSSSGSNRHDWNGRCGWYRYGYRRGRGRCGRGWCGWYRYGCRRRRGRSCRSWNSRCSRCGRPCGNGDFRGYRGRNHGRGSGCGSSGCGSRGYFNIQEQRYALDAHYYVTSLNIAYPLLLQRIQSSQEKHNAFSQ